MESKKRTPGILVEDVSVVGVTAPDGQSKVVARPASGKVAESVGKATDKREQEKRVDKRK